MRKLLIIFCLIPVLAYADSLRVVVSADGWIGSKEVTKSFTTSTATADIALTFIGDGFGLDQTNFGGSATTSFGKISGAGGAISTLVRFEDMDDVVSAHPEYAWDSGRVAFKISTAADVSGDDDSVTLAMYRLDAARIFVEGTADGAVGYGATYDSCVTRYNSTNTGINWTTNGGFGSADTVGGRIDTTMTMTGVSNGANTWFSFKLRAADITATNAGFIIKALRYGPNDGTTSRIIVYSDDNGTAGNRPTCTLYGHAKVANFGGTDSLIVGASSGIGAKSFLLFDISSFSTTVQPDSLKLWYYIWQNYSTDIEGNATISFDFPAKPLNIGDNLGTLSDANEMNYTFWAADSNWGTIGADNVGSTCNRSDGSGNDRTAAATPRDPGVGATGWKRAMIDTTYIGKYRAGGCGSQFGLVLVGGSGAGDFAYYKIEALERSASSNEAVLVIYWPSPVTRGTTTHGKGPYDNVHKNSR